MSSPIVYKFTSERPHYSLALFSSFICTCTTSKKIEFALKRTLGYFPKNSPEYAYNRVKTLVIYYNITPTLWKSCCDVITGVR